MAGSYVLMSKIGDGARTETHDARKAKVLTAKVALRENFVLRRFATRCLQFVMILCRF
jgi:hypothetical protein